MQNYKELKVWEKSHLLVLDIYRITAKFPKEEIFGITSQIRRSAASIPANIAEGCGKNSQLDMANFLNISLGSANETDYFLLLCKDLQYISETDFFELENTINTIKAMLINLITKVRNK
ncbi:four helix bundle protein [Pedobacter sp. BS3]|uniref:four helix bundle protein n=1 Tax=Pedobacter sp. BS3 TaxID=2567937 RepID=UPI0011ED9F8E|nr:four helix bundle protein [Pedobacter sp. BS3]TZF81705.1 four helix bundle protein [Pedobacter sp. BS3]